MNFTKMKYGLIFICTILVQTIKLKAQDKGQLSGNLISSFQKFVRDDEIGANTLVYRENSNSLDAWLQLNYRYKGYSFTVRYDVFNNSPLLNPQSSYTNHGLGFWQINKKIEKLDITAGSFYDQLGTGILFRAYEQRQLGLDYAVQGLRLQYEIGKNWVAKAFGGNQKGNIDNRFGYSKQVIYGANLDGNYATKNGGINIGASAINRFLNKEVMDALVAEINNYDEKDFFIPKRNVYGFNGYVNLSHKNLSWNTEFNYKTKEGIRNLSNDLFLTDGRVLYSSLSWGKSGFKFFKNESSIGINLQARHVKNFSFRTSPNEILLNGLMSYLPSLTRQNAYRLLARYNAPAQELGENGVQMEIDFKPSEKTQITLNGSYVQSLKANGKNNKSMLLFREYYVEILRELNSKNFLKLGFQSVEYNQARYEFENEYENVITFTPFAEYTRKFSKSRSLRIEAQYLHTEKDQGSFANIIIEYFIKKNWSIAIGDMINTQPHRYSNMIIANKVLHYPMLFTSYTVGQSVFTLSAMKQQQGVNCSGGICRVEPAFSGIRLTVSTNF